MSNKEKDNGLKKIIGFIVLIVVAALAVTFVPGVVEVLNGGEFKFIFAWEHKVTVKLDPKGGEVEKTELTVIEGHEYGDLPTPTREGMTFLGWYHNVNGGEAEVTSTDIVNTLNEHTLCAKWGVTVTFDENSNYGGSTKNEEMIVPCDSKYGDLPDPSKNGVEFLGWYLEPTYNTRVDSNTTVKSTNHTLYAKWGIKVSFDTNGVGTVSSRDIVIGVDNYGTLPTLTKDGAEFLGWYTEKSGGMKVDSNDAITKKVHHTLYARWKVTVSFDANGGIVDTESKEATTGDKYGELPTPTKEGYVFGGWYTNNSYETNITEDTVVTKSNSHTLYARWKIIVSFDANGGVNSIESKEVIIGDIYGELPTPTKEGYIFDGWYTTNAYETKVTNNTIITKNSSHTLYAKWIDIIVVTFDYNGGEGSITSKNIFEGETYGELPLPTMDGYEFLGWKFGDTIISESSTVTTASNHTLVAQWLRVKKSYSWKGDHLEVTAGNYWRFKLSGHWLDRDALINNGYETITVTVTITASGKTGTIGNDEPYIKICTLNEMQLASKGISSFDDVNWHTQTCTFIIKLSDISADGLFRVEFHNSGLSPYFISGYTIAVEANK